MDLIKKTNIDFVSRRNAFIGASLLLNVVGLIAVFLLGIDYGIDFVGGTQVAVQFKQNTATIDDVRASLEKIGYAGAELKSFGGPGQYLIRVKAANGDKGNSVSQAIVNQLSTQFARDQVVILSSEKIDAKVSDELKMDSLWALIAAAIIIVLYVAFRFEFVYGLGAIVALVHDVLMAFVISVLFNKLGWINLETNINSIAAYLTILGYSINDKVVVFDRIRENKDKHKGMGLAELINLSLNETLSRTLITGIAVLAALLVMVFFGGEVLEGFAFTMFIGIVIGTYSSIYIASSFVIWFDERRKQGKTSGVVAKA